MLFSDLTFHVTFSMSQVYAFILCDTARIVLRKSSSVSDTSLSSLVLLYFLIQSYSLNHLNRSYLTSILIRHPAFHHYRLYFSDKKRGFLRLVSSLQCDRNFSLMNVYIQIKLCGCRARTILIAKRVGVLAALDDTAPSLFNGAPSNISNIIIN